MSQTTALKRKTGPKAVDPSVRFWSKVDSTAGPDACWFWTASLDIGGYGKFYRGRVDGKHALTPAHRFSYELHVGEIPEGYQVDHRCHVAGECFGNEKCPHRACVNPAHLKAVTPQENVLRGNTIVADQVARTHCPQGHQYTSENIYWHGRSRRKKNCRACTLARRKNLPRRLP